MKVVRTLFGALRRRWPLAALLFVLFSAGAVAGAYFQSPSYESRAKVLLNFDGRPISLSQAEIPRATPGLLAAEAVTTLSEIFDSRDLIERLVDDLGQDAFASPPPSNQIIRALREIVSDIKDIGRDLLIEARLLDRVSPRDALVADVEENLSVFPVRQSQIVEIAFEWSDAAVPPLVLGRLLELYQARIAELNAQAVEETVLSDQARRASRSLERARAELSELRESTSIVDPAQSREFLVARIQRLESLLAYDVAPGAESAGDQSPGSELAALHRSLTELKIERAGALERYTPTSLEVRVIDGRIRETESELAKERGRIETALDHHREALVQVLATENEFADARRDIELANEAYRTYRQAAADRRVMRLGVEELRIKVIDRPGSRASLAGPTRFVIVLVGLLLSVLAACFIALAFERLQSAAEDGDENGSESDSGGPRSEKTRPAIMTARSG